MNTTSHNSCWTDIIIILAIAAMVLIHHYIPPQTDAEFFRFYGWTFALITLGTLHAVLDSAGYYRGRPLCITRPCDSAHLPHRSFPPPAP